MNDAPTIVASERQTESTPNPWADAPASQVRARIRRLNRANHLMRSQMVGDEVKPLDKWPRSVRREFARLARKENRVADKMNQRAEHVGWQQS